MLGLVNMNRAVQGEEGGEERGRYLDCRMIVVAQAMSVIFTSKNGIC